MDSIERLTKVGVIQSKPERLREGLIDLLKRIFSAVEKVFYILVPVARKEFKVTIIADNDVSMLNTKNILKTLLPYQFEIKSGRITQEEFVASDLTGHRVVHLICFTESTELYRGMPIHRKMQDEKTMKSLLIMPDNRPPLIGPNWDELIGASHYVDANNPKAYAQALENFMS